MFYNTNGIEEWELQYNFKRHNMKNDPEYLKL